MPIGSGRSRETSSALTRWNVQTFVSVGPYRFISTAAVHPARARTWAMGNGSPAKRMARSSTGAGWSSSPPSRIIRVNAEGTEYQMVI